jgi:hypothetical protein
MSSMSQRRSNLKPSQTSSPFSGRTLGLVGLGILSLVSGLQAIAQSDQASQITAGSVAPSGRINGKYTGKIQATADAGVVYNLFIGDREFDFRTELNLGEDSNGRVSGSALFLDQKNRRSVGNPNGQHTGSRLQFSIPLRENCAPIQVKAVVSADAEVMQFPASSQVVNCSSSGISVGVRIKLKAFTLAR